MNQIYRQKNPRKRTIPLTLILLSVAVTGLLVCSPGRGSHAQQQQRDRQLVQTGSPQSGDNGKRLALVIGNGTYVNAPTLKNPPNDATDMADALSKLGFNVEHGVNLSQRQMKLMIRDFGRKLKSGGEGLFYFAGHGVQLRGRNFLIPVDADIQSETDVEDQGVDANLVMGLMDEAGNGLNVVILDACRNNPFARSFRSVANGLAQVEAPTGTLIAYATSPGRVARDGAGRNGAYTAELLRQMNIPGLGIEELLKRVRANLKQQTNGEQVPWEASSLVGDFYLNRVAETSRRTDNSAGGTTGATVNSAAIEQEFWDSIKNSTDAEDFRSYLKEYPNGAHAPIARNKLRKLEESRANNVSRDRTNPNGAAINTNNPAATSPARPSARELGQRSYNLWRACDYDQAISVATEAINNYPVMAEGYLNRGAAYLFKLELDQAVSDLNEAIRLQPNNALAYRWRAMAYWGLSIHNINAGAFEALGNKDRDVVLQLIVNPKEAWEYEARGYAHYLAVKFDLAISDLDQAIRLDPQYLPAYVIRGAARNFKSGKITDEVGIKDMSEAIRLNPRFMGAYLYRGVFLYVDKKGDYIADLSAALRLAPKGVALYGFRGDAYYTQDKHALAVNDYSEAIRLGGKKYLKDRAYAYTKLGSYEAALRDFTEYIIYVPDVSYIYKERAKVYRALGRIALAEADEKKAKELEKK